MRSSKEKANCLRYFSTTAVFFSLTVITGCFIKIDPSYGLSVNSTSQISLGSSQKRVSSELNLVDSEKHQIVSANRVKLISLTLAQLSKTRKSGQPLPIASSVYVNAKSGLLVRNAPAGYVIGKRAYRERIGLTGAEQFAKGRTWAQISGGGWVAKDYLSF